MKVGDRVGVKWLANSCVSIPFADPSFKLTIPRSCLNCEQCRNGREQNCYNAQLSGYTVDGTFSEYVVSFVNHVTPIPEGFSTLR